MAEKKKKSRAEYLTEAAKAGKLKYGKAYLELNKELNEKKKAWKKKNPNKNFLWDKLMKKK